MLLLLLITFILLCGGSEWSSSLKIVNIVSFLISRVSGKVVLISVFSHNLNINISDVFWGEALTFRGLKSLRALILNFLNSSNNFSSAVSVLLTVQLLDELIVVFIGS